MLLGPCNPGKWDRATQGNNTAAKPSAIERPEKRKTPFGRKATLFNSLWRTPKFWKILLLKLSLRIKLFYIKWLAVLKCLMKQSHVWSTFQNIVFGTVLLSLGLLCRADNYHSNLDSDALRAMTGLKGESAGMLLGSSYNFWYFVAKSKILEDLLFGIVIANQIAVY